MRIAKGKENGSFKRKRKWEYERETVAENDTSFNFFNLAQKPTRQTNTKPIDKDNITTHMRVN